jgi:hypothetical protein
MTLATEELTEAPQMSDREIDRPSPRGGGKRSRVLAVASGGGHWVQLLRLTPALLAHDTAFVTVQPYYRSDVRWARFYLVNDATLWNKLGLVRLALRILWILIRERPQFVISTGAAPGFFALRLGKLFGARTMWLDSIANVERLSTSGEKIGPTADLWLTQWEHLARPDGPKCAGAVL